MGNAYRGQFGPCCGSLEKRKAARRTCGKKRADAEASSRASSGHSAPLAAHIGPHSGQQPVTVLGEHSQVHATNNPSPLLSTQLAHGPASHQFASEQWRQQFRGALQLDTLPRPLSRPARLAQPGAASWRVQSAPAARIHSSSSPVCSRARNRPGVALQGDFWPASSR